MVNIIKQEIEMETALKNKIEFICSFCNAMPIIYNGSVRTIEHTNISYVEPHRIIVSNKINTLVGLLYDNEDKIYLPNENTIISLTKYIDYFLICVYNIYTF